MTLNPLCFYNIEAEPTSHYFLRYYVFDVLWTTLNDLRNIVSDLPTLTDENLTNILL